MSGCSDVSLGKLPVIERGSDSQNRKKKGFKCRVNVWVSQKFDSIRPGYRSGGGVSVIECKQLRSANLDRR